MARGIDGLESELLFRRGGPLEQQRPMDYLAAREPVYACLLELLQDAVRGEAGTRLAAAWSDREFHASYERPLMLLAGLRYDALSAAGTHPLHAALAQTPPDPAAATAGALAAALSPARARFWAAVRERAVQTNETTRAVTWLWPLSLLASAGEQRSVVLVDLGTSAGLNLVADALPAAWRDADGAPIPVAPRLEVEARPPYLEGTSARGGRVREVRAASPNTTSRRGEGNSWGVRLWENEARDKGLRLGLRHCGT